MARSSITVDLSTWPVVHVVYRGDRLRLDDLPDFHAQLDRALDHAGKFVTIIDTTRLKHLPGPFVLRRNEGWVERNHAALSERSLGTVTITQNALARGIAQWILNARRIRSDGAVVSSLEEAVDWAKKRLKDRGVSFDDALVSRLLLHEGGDDASTLEPRGGTIDPDAQALIEVVLGAFSEPAFLVDERGEVLFMNAAASDLFEQPPAWVHRTLSDGHSALKALCRVAPLAIGANVFVVVPSAELLPVRGQARPALDLPDSLQKVAVPLSRGLSDREISELTGLAHTTVRTYVRRIFERADVNSRGAFIRLYAGSEGRLQM
jgi:hypothetical protein